MNDQHDLDLMVVSRFPIILIESHEEARGLELLDFHPYLQDPVNMRLVKKYRAELSQNRAHLGFRQSPNYAAARTRTLGGAL